MNVDDFVEEPEDPNQEEGQDQQEAPLDDTEADQEKKGAKGNIAGEPKGECYCLLCCVSYVAAFEEAESPSDVEDEEKEDDRMDVDADEEQEAQVGEAMDEDEDEDKDKVYCFYDRKTLIAHEMVEVSCNT